ncbi:MAG: aminopeptidase P family protein [Planctomycetes bacterium]|nr:aminopeptidase P family protein [Planctomycetota bacterium]
MTMDFARRRGRLESLFRRRGFDHFLVTHEPNVAYLTGFTGGDTALLLTRGRPILLSDARYEQQLAEECPGLELAIRRPPRTMHEHYHRTLRSAGVRHLAFEGDHMTVDQATRIQDGPRAAAIAPLNGLTAQLRAVKDRHEIACIRRSIAVAERAYEDARASMRPDWTERRMACELEYRIRLLGGSGCSFPPIVGAGPRAALPHGRPGDTRIDDHPFTLVDWGATVDGYASDLTRLMVKDKIPPKLERVYGVVLRAQLAAIAAIRPGARMGDVDRAARHVIEDAGFGRRFGHGSGHGFGLEIHEQPRLAPGQDGLLKAGMVVTVEPGIYLPGWGGVRIEDDVLVTRAGHDVMTTVAKDLCQ